MPYMSKLVKRLAVAWVIVTVAAACGAETQVTAAEPEDPTLDSASVASVRVVPDSLDVRAGRRLRMVAEPRDRQGRLLLQEPVTWQSSNTQVAVVDTAGYVITLAAGTADITASSRGRVGKGRLKVTLEPVATVTVSPSAASVQTGQTIALGAQLLSIGDSVLADRSVTWSSSAPAIATVDSLGVVRGVSAGSAQIRASSEGITGVAAVTVTLPPPGAPGTVADLSVSAVTDSSATLRFTEVTDGAGAPASYEVRYTTGTMSWSTATPVARGTCTAPVVGVSVGAIRTCAVHGLAAATLHRFQVRAVRGTGTAAVLGAVSNVASGTTSQAVVASVTLTPATAALTVGQTATFAATVRDANGNVLTGRTITWSSTNTALATVTTGGVATARAAGTVTIRGTTGGQTGSATITITAPAQSAVATVTLSPTSDTAMVGQTVTYTPTLRDSAGAVLTGRTITWSSTNAAVATVSSTGVVTGVTAGTTTIRATSEGQSGNATVLVVAATVPVATVTVAPLIDTLTIGQTATFTATTRDASGAILTGRTVTWTSTNTTVATVTASGVVTARIAGTATIRATSEGQIGTATLLVVSPPPAPVASVTVGPASATAAVGAGAQFSVTLRDAAGSVLTGRSVTWSSSSVGVATVNAAGLAQAVAVGSTTIRATSEGQTGSATLTVTAAPPPGATVFSSDWSTATGNSMAAITDGGRYDNVYCASASQTLSVVPGSALGWTKTPNVLRAQQLGSSICGQLEKVAAVPLSTTHWGRFYFRNDETATTHHHVATYNPLGDVQVAIWNREGGSNGVKLFLRTYKNSSNQDAGWPDSWWELPGLLANGVWYRYEWQMEYVTATTYRLWPRVYNMAGTLIADADDYVDSNLNRTMAQFYAAGGVFGVTPSLARNFGLGNEGPAMGGSTGGYWYHANVALSLTGWIGQ